MGTSVFQRRAAMQCLLAALVVQSVGCAPRVTGSRLHELTVAVEPPGSEVAVYRWNGDIAAGPATSPTTLQWPQAKGQYAYLVRASSPGSCTQYLVVSQEPPTPVPVPWMAIPGSGEGALIAAGVIVAVVLVLWIAAAVDDAPERYELVPAVVSGTLPSMAPGCERLRGPQSTP
jgi:hypothetical protein